MFCEHCGAKIKEGAQFCQSCGKSTSETVNHVNTTDNTTDNTTEPLGKCDECKYSGPGELSRKTLSQVLAWLSVCFNPLITIGYYSWTHKHQCPNCESTSIHVKNKKGVFINQKETKTFTKIVVWVLLGLFVTGIIYTLVSLIK